MIEIGRRRRKQPAPPVVVFEALSDPDRDPARRWLILLDDEVRPLVRHLQAPTTLEWSSLWPARSDATITFDLAASADGGTDLQWTIHVDEPAPDDVLVGQMRKRLNELINANLRYTFGR